MVDQVPPIYTPQNVTKWDQLSEFEIRSCATKRRFKSEPPLPSMAYRSYPCDFCGGWHLASRYKKPGSWKDKYR